MPAGKRRKKEKEALKFDPNEYLGEHRIIPLDQLTLDVNLEHGQVCCPMPVPCLIMGIMHPNTGVVASCLLLFLKPVGWNPMCNLVAVS